LDIEERAMIMMMFRTAAVLGLIVTASLTAMAAGPGIDWPNFRGPDYSGITTEKNWSADWPADGPKIAWTKDVGRGFGSFAAVGDRIYVAGNVGNTEHIHCLDAKTGKPIWQFKYPGKLVDNMHEGGPAATPTIHDGKLYMLGREGQVHCLNAATGAVLWKDDLRKLLKMDVPQWGFSSSAFIEGDMVIYQAGATIAFNKNSGKVMWISKPHPAGYTTPQAVTINGKRMIASLSCFGLVMLDPATGNEIASTKWDTKYDTSAAAPIFVGDKVFLTAGYGKGCALFQFTGDSFRQLWANKDMSNHMNSSVLIDGTLYGVSGNSNESSRCQLVAMDYETGKVHWAQRGIGCGSVIAAGDKLITLTDKGTLQVVAAKPDGYQLITQAPVLDGKCWTHPILSHGRIYARTADGDMVCVDVSGN
jgi:outer membrane protein assembly factor BamB